MVKAKTKLRISARDKAVIDRYNKARARNVLRRGVRRRAAGRAALNKQIDNRIKLAGEPKFKPLANMDEKLPAAIQTGAKTFHCGFVLGATPSGWTGFNELGGMVIPQGAGDGQRNGDYVNLKRTALTLNLETKFNNTQYPPMEFRILHCRQRRANLPAGVNVPPSTHLFLSTAGQPCGSATSGIKGVDLMMQPVNKRQFICYRDIKVILAKPPHVDSDGGGQQPDASYKNSWTSHFSFKFPSYKTKYNDVTNLPENVAYHHFIIIYARCLSTAQNADAWEVNTRGTTMYWDC